jgi:hypothetical protein
MQNIALFLRNVREKRYIYMLIDVAQEGVQAASVGLGAPIYP